MTEAQIREVIFKVLNRIAPEADLAGLEPDANLREALDIDSFDHLNLLIGLNEAAGGGDPGSRLRAAHHPNGHQPLPDCPHALTPCCSNRLSKDVSRECYATPLWALG